MKKLISLVLAVLLMLSFCVTAFGWSVPYDIAYDDTAVLYFAVAEEVFPSENAAVVRPVKLIKGDIPLRELHLIKDISGGVLVPGNVYIFASVEEGIHPTYVFTPTSYDTDTLSFKDKNSNNEDIIENINSGYYKEADDKRIDAKNDEISEKVRYSLAEVLELREGYTDDVTVTEDFSFSYNTLYDVIKDIEVRKIKKDGAYSENTVLSFTAKDVTFSVTSDAKIIIGENGYRAEYTLSTADRDRLLSLVPEKELSLPTINHGTSVFFIFILSAIILFAILIIILILIIVIKLRHKKKPS